MRVPRKSSKNDSDVSWYDLHADEHNVRVKRTGSEEDELEKCAFFPKRELKNRNGCEYKLCRSCRRLGIYTETMRLKVVAQRVLVKRGSKNEARRKQAFNVFKTQTRTSTPHVPHTLQTRSKPSLQPTHPPHEDATTFNSQYSLKFK